MRRAVVLAFISSVGVTYLKRGTGCGCSRRLRMSAEPYVANNAGQTASGTHYSCLALSGQYRHGISCGPTLGVCSASVQRELG